MQRPLAAVPISLPTGLISVFIWKDDTTGVLIGITFWGTKADYDAARADMDMALGGADFRTLDSFMEIHRGYPVFWTARRSEFFRNKRGQPGIPCVKSRSF